MQQVLFCPGRPCPCLFLQGYDNDKTPLYGLNNAIVGRMPYPCMICLVPCGALREVY